MIPDDAIRDLPEDPKLAFCEYVRLLREELAQEITEQGDTAERSFVSKVRAFTDSHDIGYEISSAPVNSNDFWGVYHKLIEDLDYITAKFRLEGLRGGASQDQGLIELNDDYRSQIHKHLITVRKIINAVEIEERLRENILLRLNALAKEVDKNRSSLMRFTDAFVEVCAATGDGAEKLDPAVKILERIGGIFGKARKEGDVKKVSVGDEQKLISPPVDDAETGDSSGH